MAGSSVLLVQQDPWHKESKDCCLHQHNFAKLGVFFFHCSSASSYFPLPQMPVPGVRSRPTNPDVCWPFRQPLFSMSYPPDEGACGGRTSSPAMGAWGCWCWADVGLLWQTWDLKALFTHMLVHTLQGHGAATSPGPWVGDKGETAQPWWGVDIFGTIHSSMVWTPRDI